MIGLWCLLEEYEYSSTETAIYCLQFIESLQVFSTEWSWGTACLLVGFFSFVCLFKVDAERQAA